MKRTSWALFGLGIVVIGSIAVQFGSASATPTEKPVEQFMRQKLTHSQDVLEGLVTEDFDQVAKAAADMRTLSQAAAWQVLRTPTYDLFSREFQTACDQLEKSAKAENSDGASLAWIKVTMTCLSCHKHVRNAKIAEAPLELDVPKAASATGE